MLEKHPQPVDHGQATLPEGKPDIEIPDNPKNLMDEANPQSRQHLNQVGQRGWVGRQAEAVHRHGHGVLDHFNGYRIANGAGVFTQLARRPLEKSHADHQFGFDTGYALDFGHLRGFLGFSTFSA